MTVTTRSTYRFYRLLVLALILIGIFATLWLA